MDNFLLRTKRNFNQWIIYPQVINKPFYSTSHYFFTKTYGLFVDFWERCTISLSLFMISICPQCKGAGLISEAKCPTCRGNEEQALSATLLNTRLFFNFEKVTEWNIAARRAAFTVDTVINFSLRLIGGVGILFLAFYIYRQILSLNINIPLGLFSSDVWNLQSPYLRVFLATFLIDLYTVYRTMRAQELEMYVIKKEYQENEKRDAQIRSVSINRAFSRFALEVIENAYLFALQNHYSEVLPLHLLAVLIAHPHSNIILFRLGINPGALAGKIKHGLQGLLYQEQQSGQPKRMAHFSPETKLVILNAYMEAHERGGEKVQVWDLWTPIADIEGYAKEILYDLDIETYKMRHVGQWVQVEEDLRRKTAFRRAHSHGGFFARHGMDRAMTAVETKTLNSFSTDLTYMASRGALPPSLGRAKEIEQVFTILQSGAAGVMLVGGIGVGKESIVDEIAARMSADMAPDILRDKRLVALSVASVLAGGGAEGSAERLYRALYEAAHSGNILLFIKDIHYLVGVGLKGEAGASTVGMDAVLTEALQSRRFFVIGTTDYKNYSLHIEHSPLRNVLTRIEVLEPNLEDTVLMLEARAPFIEGKHGVFFTYQALTAAVEFSNKLIHTEHQPEKAETILREVASSVATSRGRRAVVTDQDVAKTIAQKINMPIARLEKSESEKLLRLEEEIHKRYINQDYAVVQVSAALRRARAELRDERRPIANFLFVGPTGVGKTELVKRIASVYFNSEKDMVRLDMSEFQEIGGITRLIGEGETPGLLTESVRMNPYSVLLLDELEKAHPNILNLFLQVMDDGRLTSGEGEVIDFTNLIIVATSNAGTKKVQEYLASGKRIEDIREQFVKKDLLEWFKPEFINRFDDVIVFKPLSEENIQAIAQLILTDIAGKLESKGIKLRIAPGAVVELANFGFDPLFGARPLRRAIQDHVQNALANYLIAGQIGRRDTVHLEPGGVIRIEKAAEL